MKTFHVQLFFQAVTDSSSNHRSANNDIHSNWHQLINLVTVKLKRNKEMLRVLSKKRKHKQKKQQQQQQQRNNKLFCQFCEIT